MIPLVIAAKNEARALGASLDSLLASAAHAERHAEIRFDFRVILDDCTDATAAVAASRGVRTIVSSAEERRLFLLFQAAMKGCELVHAAERAFYLHLSRSACEDWSPIDETKRPIEASGLHG